MDGEEIVLFKPKTRGPPSSSPIPGPSPSETRTPSSSEPPSPGVVLGPGVDGAVSVTRVLESSKTDTPGNPSLSALFALGKQATRPTPKQVILITLITLNNPNKPYNPKQAIRVGELEQLPTRAPPVIPHSQFTGHGGRQALPPTKIDPAITLSAADLGSGPDANMSRLMSKAKKNSRHGRSVLASAAGSQVAANYNNTNNTDLAVFSSVMFGPGPVVHNAPGVGHFAYPMHSRFPPGPLQPPALMPAQLQPPALMHDGYRGPGLGAAMAQATYWLQQHKGGEVPGPLFR
jgi:hypothetical protein